MSEQNVKKKSVVSAILSKKESGAAIPLIALMIAVACVNQNFFGIFNLMDVLRTASFSLMVAVPVTFLIASGGLDLSVGACISLGGVVCGNAIKAGIPIPFAIVLSVLTGLVVGLFNGICVVHFSLPGFIATLGTQYCINGIINVWTSGLSISNLPKVFTQLGQFRIGGYVSLPIIYALVIAIIGHVLLSYAKFGRKVLAVGGNAETARLAGISVKRTRIMTYMAVSAFAALTGVIYGARFATVQPTIGTGTEMTIMAAVIVGGTSMMGGVGTIIGTALGCFLLASITNVLIMMEVSSYWQPFIFGLILIVSLFIDRYRQRILKA
ncbi:MAG: ABC transporter permease [Clostridiales bacterium]|nr:ABC transporter permease [Clostridiales bacterium]